MSFRIHILSPLFLLGLTGLADAAGNVDLSTVPARSTVQLTIYNSEDITLVRETRARDVQEGGQPAAVHLGEHADRSHRRSS